VFGDYESKEPRFTLIESAPHADMPLPAAPEPTSAVPWKGPLRRIPVGWKECVEVYGDPNVTHDAKGQVHVDPRWERKSLAKFTVPGFPKPLYMHRIAYPYAVEAMRRAALWCPSYKVERVGCYNPRHMRFDRSRPLSIHTIACAFDINSGKNPGRYFKGKRPETFGRDWIAYSDMPPEFVRAWESVGFEWGGRWGTGKDRFIDGMHFQLTWTSHTPPPGYEP